MQTFSLAERPDLVDAYWQVRGDWPDFMLEDPIAETAYEAVVETYPQLHLVALDGSAPVARLHAAPLMIDSLDALPPRGWDHVMQEALAAPAEGWPMVSLLEARVLPDRRGEGLSARLLTAARRQVTSLGVRDLVAPVRPTGKHREPRTSADAYARRTREDGLPADPWLRTHVRLGGRILRVAPTSMTIPGTLAQWRGWTGLPFDADGAVEVPGALAPVHVDVAGDHAVYVEANVWVHHDLRD